MVAIYMKHLKVKVYLLEFKLTINPDIDNFKHHSFSRGDTVGYLEAVLKQEFEVEENADCCVRHNIFNMPHVYYELLPNYSQTLLDAHLYNGQVK